MASGNGWLIARATLMFRNVDALICWYLETRLKRVSSGVICFLHMFLFVINCTSIWKINLLAPQRGQFYVKYLITSLGPSGSFAHSWPIKIWSEIFFYAGECESDKFCFVRHKPALPNTHIPKNQGLVNRRQTAMKWEHWWNLRKYAEKSRQVTKEVGWEEVPRREKHKVRGALFSCKGTGPSRTRLLPIPAKTSFSRAARWSIPARNSAVTRLEVW